VPDTGYSIRGHPDIVPTNPESGLEQVSGTISKTGSRFPPEWRKKRVIQYKNGSAFIQVKLVGIRKERVVRP